MKLFNRVLLSFTLCLVWQCCPENREHHENSGQGTFSSSLPLEIEVDTEGLTPLDSSGMLQVVVEIPAGTLAKYEYDKKSKSLRQEMTDTGPRKIRYMPYPGNYGFVPGTLLDEASGGDGDPLDVIVLGPAAERGSILTCKLLGVLYLFDNQEKDDKLIAVSANSPLSHVESLAELQKEYPGTTLIFRTWFTHYKGSRVTFSPGFGNRGEALNLLESAMQ